MSNKDKRKNVEKKSFVFSREDKTLDQDWEEVEKLLFPPISEKEVDRLCGNKGYIQTKRRF